MTNYRFEGSALEKKLSEIEESILKPITLKDLMTKEFPKIPWIAEKLIPMKSIVAISGIPSAYKTWLILDLAIKIAKGEILFDKFITNKTGVLLVDEETGEQWIKERIIKLGADNEIPIYLLSKTGFKLTDASVKDLINFCNNFQVGIVIFDSLLRIHTARDENDAVQMAKVISLFQKINNADITVIFTHHHRKQGILRSSSPSQDMRGSSDILAAVDCHLAVERKEDYVIINQTKLRQSEEVKPFRLDVVNEENEFHFNYWGEIEEEATKKTDIKKAIKEILEKTGKPMYKQELHNNIKDAGIEGGYSTFKNAVKELVAKGELFEKRAEKNKVYCSLVAFDQEMSLISKEVKF